MLNLTHGLVPSSGDVTARHSETVARLATAVAAELGLDSATCDEIEAAGLLHDVGKTEIPKAILGKCGLLTERERRLLEMHTILGEALVTRVNPSLRSIARIVRSCHERWDGAGYPDGLAGEEIPLAARIVFCCDAYEAMTSDRPYRAGIGQARAVKELWACSGTQFDPEVVTALVRALARVRLEDRVVEAAPTSPRAPRASARATSG